MGLGLSRVTALGGVAALAAVLAAPSARPAHALEGDVAKGLGKADWINGPVLEKFEDLRGQVIFVELWGLN